MTRRYASRDISVVLVTPYVRQRVETIVVIVEGYYNSYLQTYANTTVIVKCRFAAAVIYTIQYLLYNLICVNCLFHPYYYLYKTNMKKFILQHTV